MEGRESIDMEKPELILADIDGTMVDTEGHDMTPLNRRILQYIHDKGVLFGIASGRPCDELPLTIQKYGLSFTPDFIVGMNGGEILDTTTGEIAVFDQLQPEWIQTIIELMAPFEKVNPVIYRDHILVCKYYDDLIKTSEEHANKKSRVIEDIEEYWSAPVGKIMFRTQTPEECDEIEVFAKAHIDSSLAAFKTQPTLLEVQDANMNKGVALMEISQRTGIDPSKIVAYGDASNDNEMLKAAGLGVCMVNGLPDTKESADVITEIDNDHDGMAYDLIARFPKLFEDFDLDAELAALNLSRPE